MRARLVVTALVLCLALAACSDDDGGEGATPTTAAGRSGTNEALDAQEAADLLKADQVVLKQADFPEGWTAIPRSAEVDEQEDRAGEEFELCLGAPVDDDDRPKAESPQFERGQFSRVASSVEFAPTVEDARKELSALQGPKLAECLQAQFDKELRTLAADVEFGPVKVESTPFPALGDGTVAARLSTTVAAADGSAIPLYNDFVFVLKGRAGISLTLTNAGEPFPTELAADLAGKMAARA